MLRNSNMAKADTANTATPQASPELLSLPPIAVENILRSASFSGALAACSCRALRDAWRGLTSSNPEFAATALVDRFQTVDAAAANLYKPGLELRTDPLVNANIAPPALGLLDPVVRPVMFTLSALREKRPPSPALGYLTATAASDAHALALLRHLLSLREGAGREANAAPVSQANSDGGGGNASQGGPVAGQEQAVRTTKPLPSSLYTGAAFAGHAATVVELLRHGADPVYTMLPGAVLGGNARLCAALLEGGRMAGAACDWSTAAGGDVLGIRGNPSGFVDSYAGSSAATLHMWYIDIALLPLACIGRPPGLAGDEDGVRCSRGSGGSRSSSGRTRGSVGSTSGVYALGNSTRALLQRAVGGWCSGGAGPVQPAEDVAAALAAARAAAEHAADTALGDSNPMLPQFVQSIDAAAAAAAAAATAAALAALTPPDASYGGSSSSSRSGSGGGGGSSAHHPGQACAFLSSTTSHAAVRQLLLQWRPAEGRDPPPQLVRATALPHAAAVGAWPAVSELLRAGVDPRDTDAPATLLYLALVQGRGAMAAWLLVRLLARPAGVWKPVMGAAYAAFVTRIMGIASPLQLLLRYKSVLYMEAVLDSIGRLVVLLLAGRILPHMFLPWRINDLPLTVYTIWKLWPYRR